MSIKSKFQDQLHRLFVNAGDGDNSVTISSDAGGHLLVNGDAVDGEPTIANTDLIRVTGGDGNDVIALNEANGALPAAELAGGDGNETLTGGSRNQLAFRAGRHH